MKLNRVYWKGDQFWLGKLLEHPEIMTQGETLEELEENLNQWGQRHLITLSL